MLTKSVNTGIAELSRVALIAVVIAGTVVLLGNTLKDKFDQAQCSVAGAADGGELDCAPDE